jgi:thymidine phosphorylase
MSKLTAVNHQPKTPPVKDPRHGQKTHELRLRRFGIDTHQEAVIYMRDDCHVCRSEGFEAQSRILIRNSSNSIVATLNVVHNGLISPGEAGLSEAAWKLLNAQEGEIVRLSHPPALASLGKVRAKIYGRRLSRSDYREIVSDIVAGRYSDIDLSAFVTACAGEGRMEHDEIVGLTEAMIETGERLSWETSPVMDKHCVGGLPGNRTTLLIVPIITAFGLTMPKTSSRAITSPAGTADTMETLAPVNLDLREMRRVVEREGGCVVWGGAVKLSPADDRLIRVERALDIDGEGQMIASILSKKAAAGSTHVLLDIPVGATAKVRDFEAARKLGKQLKTVGNAVGLNVQTIISDGSQPVGRGIGPALEARDVLAVLQNEPYAPDDLRERALILAGHILEMSTLVAEGQGRKIAQKILEDGRAWKKFLAICEAQGGLRELTRADFTQPIVAQRGGIVTAIDNRKLARIAKLAGAPRAQSAGVEFHAPVGCKIETGQPVYTVHAETGGELDYALEFVRESNDRIISIEGI